MTAESNAEQGKNPLWDEIILPVEVKRRLQDAWRLIQRVSSQKPLSGKGPHLLISGPPGTGKTMIVKTFRQMEGVRFIGVIGPDLRTGGHYGESKKKVQEIFSKARNCMPSILCIDMEQGYYSDYCVFPRRDSPGHDFVSEEIILETCAQIEALRRDHCPVFLVGEAFSVEEVNPWILREFDLQIEIPLPDEDCRRQILISKLRKHPMDPSLDLDEVSTFLAKRLKKCTGRDLENLVHRAKGRVAERDLRNGRAPDDALLTREDLIADVEVPTSRLEKTWGSLAIHPEVKETILREIHRFNSGAHPFPRGLLLYGPPGAGKTGLARLILDSTKTELFRPYDVELRAGSFNPSGEYARNLWQIARSSARSVIFLDDCEGLLAERSPGDDDSPPNEFRREFLAAWETLDSDSQVWIVATTNQRELLSETVAGRFETQLEIQTPKVTDPNDSWDALMLSGESLGKLKQFCNALLNFEKLQSLGIRLGRGALMYGPPGIDLGEIAVMFAKHSGLSFIAVKGLEIKSSFIGKYESNFRQLFERARQQAPCILFIDEIERVASARGTALADDCTNEIVSEILTAIDGVPKDDPYVLLLGATHSPELIDRAVWCHATMHFEISYPSPEERRHFFKKLLEKHQRADLDIDALAEELARRGGEMSGRQIQAVVRAAEQESIRLFGRIVLSRNNLLNQFSMKQLHQS